MGWWLSLPKIESNHNPKFEDWIEPINEPLGDNLYVMGRAMSNRVEDVNDHSEDTLKYLTGHNSDFKAKYDPYNTSVWDNNETKPGRKPIDVTSFAD